MGGAYISQLLPTIAGTEHDLSFWVRSLIGKGKYAAYWDSLLVDDMLSVKNAPMTQANFSWLYANANATTAPATLSGIAISPASASISLIAPQAYVFTARYSYNSTAIVTASANLSSSVNGIATALNTGVATGLSFRTTTISASLNGQTANPSLYVIALSCLTRS